MASSDFGGPAPPRTVQPNGPAGEAEGQAFFGRPVGWILFALGLLAVPAVAYIIRAGWTWQQIHPALNACLNGTSGIFLVAGFLAIRSRRIEAHKRLMLSAFISSTVFLISYLLRSALSGTHTYPGHGLDRTLYLAILFSHMILSAVLLPMVLRTLYLAWKKRFVSHKRIARITWPIWIYTSVTGVLVYIILYHLAPTI